MKVVRRLCRRVLTRSQRSLGDAGIWRVQEGLAYVHVKIAILERLASCNSKFASLKRLPTCNSNLRVSERPATCNSKFAILRRLPTPTKCCGSSESSPTAIKICESQRDRLRAIKNLRVHRTAYVQFKIANSERPPTRNLKFCESQRRLPYVHMRPGALHPAKRPLWGNRIRSTISVFEVHQDLPSLFDCVCRSGNFRSIAGQSFRAPSLIRTCDAGAVFDPRSARRTLIIASTKYKTYGACVVPDAANPTLVLAGEYTDGSFRSVWSRARIGIGSRMRFHARKWSSLMGLNLHLRDVWCVVPSLAIYPFRGSLDPLTRAVLSKGLAASADSLVLWSSLMDWITRKVAGFFRLTDSINPGAGVLLAFLRQRIVPFDRHVARRSRYCGHLVGLELRHRGEGD